MIQIHKIPDFELYLYSPEQRFLGILRHDSELIDVLLQIKQERLDGYYIVDSMDREKYVIEPHGFIPNARFRNRSEELLAELVGF